jgi:restriction system protein
MINKDIYKGPQFVKYFSPVIEALKKLGGSGRPSEVKEVITEELTLSETDLNETISSGASRFSKNVDWARFYLAKAGYIDASVRGVWTLTTEGEKERLSPEKAYDIFSTIHQTFSKKTEDKSTNTASSDGQLSDEVDIAPEDLDHRAALLNILLSLPPEGFEKLCQRLLRESGFEKVTVTGKSGDGGIDGIGILQMNPFVSFKVLFQSKRYSGAVTVSQVRDFRGAMMGRTDKGIIITTGTFTAEAKKEAAREGVPPIELVDNEKLMDMFEHLELGLRAKTAYDVDPHFFEPFR